MKLQLLFIFLLIAPPLMSLLSVENARAAAPSATTESVVEEKSLPANRPAAFKPASLGSPTAPATRKTSTRRVPARASFLFM